MPEKLFKVQYAPTAAEDLRALRAYDQRKILAAVERHLFHDPTQVSRTRIKRMIQPFWSQFRLRAEDFRVYYDVDVLRRTVSILRVLKKGQGETSEEPSYEAD
jgi:mRNA-degrading endonuclease RelE of RelBE toxin-antitoxin system